MTDLAIITTCHGRLRHLRQTLRSNAGIAPVIVVDGEDEKNVNKLCNDFANVTHVPSPSYSFWKTRLQNVGAWNASNVLGAEWFAFVDSDVALIGDRWLSREWLVPGEFYIGPKDSMDLTGFLLVNAFDFWASGGFDLAIRDWGGEDWEMRLRLYALLRIKPTRIGLECFNVLRHSDEERVRYHRDLELDRPLSPLEQKQVSLERNANYIHHKFGLAMNNLHPFQFADLQDLMEMEKR